ncbi:RNA polymerase factor sigma-54 [Xanthomonadaceae bacterium XH05]|nr:RNA polymerase factor sigma-54 [Xanthomonadaceae bacterium XH05]
MKPTLQLRLGQSLTLTPQLRQAIRLLQLSSVELETEISQALESNPLLERPDEAMPEPEPPSHDATAQTPADERGDEAPGEDYELDVPDWDLDDYGRGSGAAPGSEGDDERETILAGGEEDLQDHLLWQLNLTPMSTRDRAIAVTLIESIGEDGYLGETLDALRDGLHPEIDAELDEIETVLHRIQHFDPLGVGARSLSECLDIQLSPSEPSAVVELARHVVAQHLESLAKLGPERLAVQLGVASELMHEAVTLVRSLDPRPGSGYARATPEYIAPDAYVVRRRGTWQVQLGPGCRQRLGINRHYESLIGVACKSDSTYLRGQLQEARWLIKSLETRADTVLRVAECIVRHQSGFLDFGPEAMRPLVLREVAEELDLHESTISRVTTRKYLHTPRGTFEFKHFFSSGLATADGGSASSTAIQAMIRRLIEQENPRKPLSDAALVQALEREGVTVARRTVAKYREGMNISSSNERQRLK